MLCRDDELEERIIWQVIASWCSSLFQVVGASIKTLDSELPTCRSRDLGATVTSNPAGDLAVDDRCRLGLVGVVQLELSAFKGLGLVGGVNLGGVQLVGEYPGVVLWSLALRLTVATVDVLLVNNVGLVAVAVFVDLSLFVNRCGVLNDDLRGGSQRRANRFSSNLQIGEHDAEIVTADVLRVGVGGSRRAADRVVSGSDGLVVNRDLDGVSVEREALGQGVLEAVLVGGEVRDIARHGSSQTEWHFLADFVVCGFAVFAGAIFFNFLLVGRNRRLGFDLNIVYNLQDRRGQRSGIFVGVLNQVETRSDSLGLVGEVRSGTGLGESLCGARDVLGDDLGELHGLVAGKTGNLAGELGGSVVSGNVLERDLS